MEKGHKACARFLSKYEEHLTVAYRVDELLALDRIGDAVRLLKQPFVLSAALVKCIWSVHGENLWYCGGSSSKRGPDYTGQIYHFRNEC